MIRTSKRLGNARICEREWILRGRVWGSEVYRGLEFLRRCTLGSSGWNGQGLHEFDYGRNLGQCVYNKADTADMTINRIYLRYKF